MTEMKDQLSMASNKFLYIVNGLSAGRSMDCVSVDRYEIARETPFRWYVKQRSGETWFSKREHRWFTDKGKMLAKLKAEKQRRLEGARRVVEKLEGPTTVTLHGIPPAPVGEDIEL